MRQPPFRGALFFFFLVCVLIGIALGLGLAKMPRFIDVGDAVVMVLLAGTVAALLLSGAVAAMIESFTERLQQYSELVATGDVSPELLASVEQELGSTGISLKHTAERLRRQLRDLASEKEKLERTLGTMSDGVIVSDTDLRVVLANAAAERMLGISRSEALGKPVEAIGPTLKSVASAALLGAAGQVTEVHLAGGSSSGPHLTVRAVPLEDENATVTGALILLEDVTEARRLETLRRDFVANASHELKTPVSGVKLLSEALIKELAALPSDTGGRAKDFAARLRDESHRLARLTNDLLDLAKIEEGQPGRDRELVNILTVVRSVAASLETAAADAGVEMSVSLPEGESLLVQGDSTQLYAALLNLAENAIKYNDRGGHVGIEVTQESHEIRILIWDDGAGISRSDLPRIFERFYRVDKARSKATGGTGLGLSIAKNAIEHAGGRIEAESTVGVGSRFMVRLPATSGSPDDEQANR